MRQPIRRRLLTGFAALAFGLLAVAGAARPAAAAHEICLPIHDSDGDYIGEICFPLEPGIIVDIGPDPCDCPLGIAWNWDERVLTLESVAAINERIVEGFTALDAAALSRDPALRDRYRTAALGAFKQAAGALGDGSLSLGATGEYLPEENMLLLEPEPQPWLPAAGQDTLDGLGLLQRSFAEPVPEPWIAAAMEQFDEALAEMAQQAPIGR